MTNSLSSQKKLLLLTLLTSVTTLTACGQKEAQAVPSSKASAAAKVTSKPSSTAAASSAKATRATEAQSQEEPAEISSEAVSVSETNPDTETAPEEVTALPTTFNLNALSSGDYSSIAGTWANAKGQVFTVTAEGVLYFGETFDEKAHHKIEQAGLNNYGRVGGSLGFYEDGERAGGATISMVPAGVANILDAVGDIDHIEIGQSVTAGYPEEQYFRQSSQ